MSDSAAPAPARSSARRFPRRTIVGILIFIGVLIFFLTQTRLPAVLTKLPNLGTPSSGRDRSTFSQFMDPSSMPDGFEWVAFGLNLWDANAIGMFFAILLGGAASAALAPEVRMRALLERSGPVGAAIGGGMGLPLFMCSACSAPVSASFYRGGASLELTLGMILGSALFNPVGIFAIFLLMPVSMALARIAFGVVMITLVVPLIARGKRTQVAEQAAGPMPMRLPARDSGRDGWGAAIVDSVSTWLRHTADVALRLVPSMLIAGFIVGAVLVVAQPQRISDSVSSQLIAVVITAFVGTLLQLPTLFEIPLVLGVIALGLGTGPATALLLTAPSAGLITLLVLKKDLGWRIPALMLLATFVLGSLAGVIAGSL
jgi:uncharacterized protein